MTRRTAMGLMAGAVAGAAPQPIRMIMIGLDGHPNEILDPLPNLPNVTIVGFCETDAANLARAKKNPRLANARFYTNVRELVDREKDVQLAAVTNNNGERAGAVQTCLDAGLHVIAEKPLALRAADLKKIRETAARKNLKVGMLLNMRYSPQYLALRQIVESGRVGEVIQVAAQKSYRYANQARWKLKRETYGGTIAWIGIHMIDLMRWISGREFHEVTSFTSHVAFPEMGDMENVTASVFKLDNNGLGILRMDYLRPSTAPTHGDDRLRLAGTDGVVEYQMSTGVTLLTKNGQPEVIKNMPTPKALFVDFLEHAFEGKPTMLPESDVWRVCELTIAAQEAADKGRSIVTRT